MAADEDDDLFHEEFDFLDDDEEGKARAEPEPEAKEASDDAPAGETNNGERVEKKRARPKRGSRKPKDSTTESREEKSEPEGEEADSPKKEEEEEVKPPPPATDYVVHLYEHQDFLRTVDRPFTPEDAEAFASDYNRSAKAYGRFAVTAKNDAKPDKRLG